MLGRLVGLCLLLFVIPHCLNSAHADEEVFDLEIEARSLNRALLDFGQQTNTPLLFSYEVVENLTSNRVFGSYTSSQAIELILEGTGLRGTFLEGGGLSISPAPRLDEETQEEGQMKNRLKPLLYISTALLALQAAPSYGQDNVDVPQEEEEDGQIQFDTVIVTGRAGGAQITKFESSNSITTFDEEALRVIAPTSTTDLFAEVPGVWAETSGGQSGNNVFVRGIPAPGQLLFSKITVDGIPIIEEHGIFAPPDGLFKLDETVSRLETIRGGSSSVFASNAPAGVFNFITKKGTQDFEGVAKFEYGNFGHFRGDLFFAGPIDEKTTYAIGGFYRISDGVRNAGFRGDEGGQISATLTRQLERGEFSVSARYIDDRNIFYLPIPLDLDTDGNLTSFPGLDANTDTLITDDVRFGTFVQPGGNTETFDVADGIRNRAFNIGTEITYDLGGGWTIQNKNRYVDGFTNLSTHIIFDFLEGQQFLNNNYLEAAQAAFGDDVTLAARFLGDGVGSTSTFEFNPNPNFLADGTLNPDGENFGGNAGNGFIGQSGFFSFNNSFENFFNELQVSHAFDTGFGLHNLTLGSYASIYSWDRTEQISTFLHEIAGSPRGIDVFAVDAAGDVVGAVTQNSFDQFGNSFLNWNVNGSVFAFYASDEWEVTDKLRIDGGIRYEFQDFDGSVEVPGTFDVSANNPLTPAGGLATLADDNINFGTGEFIPFDSDYDEFAWSIGANYEIISSIAAYLRVSDGFRTPNAQVQATSVVNALGGDLTPQAALNEVPVNDIFQIEGGFKFDLPYVKAFVTGFYTDFTDSAFTDPVQDADGNIINAQALLSADTLGIETEVDIGPFYGFSLNAKATFQQPDISGFAFPDAAANVDLADLSSAALVGNEVPRIARRIISVRPKYDFYVGNNAGSVFLDIFNAGARFSDFTNSISIPGYTSLGLGGTLDIGERISLTVIADNLTNEIGLTEGNPRADLFAAGGGIVTSTFGRPIVGRNVRVNLAYRF